MAINAIRSEYASVVWLKKYSGMKYMLIPGVEGFYNTQVWGQYNYYYYNFKEINPFIPQR